MNIGILGPGAIGGLLASQLQNKRNKIICLASSKSKSFIEKNGLFLKSNFYGNKKFFPELKVNKDEYLDYLFLTVKGVDLENALNDYKFLYNKKTIAISLLNGTGYKNILEKYFTNKFIVGTIGFVEVFTNKEKSIIHKSNNKPMIEISYNNQFLYKHSLIIKDLLTKSNINCEIIEDENYLIWRKLIRLCTISTITSISNSDIGFARNNEPFKSIMKYLIYELCLIASKENILFDENEIEKTIYSLSPKLKTSMQKDIELNKNSEIEYILGESLRKGKSFNLYVPILSICYSYLNNIIDKKRNL